MLEKDAKNKIADWAEPLKIATRLSTWIAFPVVIGYLLGSYLDKKYNSSPKWLLIAVGISFVISMFGLVKNTISEYKKIEADVQAKKLDPPKADDKQKKD